MTDRSSESFGHDESGAAVDANDTNETRDVASFRLGAPDGAQPRAASTRSGYLPGVENDSESLCDDQIDSHVDPALLPESYEPDSHATNGYEPDTHPQLMQSPESTFESTPKSTSKSTFDVEAPPHDKEQDLFSHLAELRARLLRCVLYTFAAMLGTWYFGRQISEWFARPIRQVLAQYAPGSKMITLDPTEGFMIYFQMTLAAALLIVAPLILMELWGFVEPALTRRERRFAIILVPFSVILFFSGAALGYAVSPLFFQFFLQFQPPESLANFSYGRSVVLLAKMLLVFGVCFQVPVVTVFITKIGLVTRNILIEYWRHVFVAIFVVVAILTPTWDPMTLTVCALPPCLLYIFSIWLVKWL